MTRLIGTPGMGHAGWKAWVGRACIILLLWIPGVGQAQAPRIGTEVYLESWQTQQDLDRLFRILSDHHMPVARIFIPQSGYAQVDMAFAAAEKFGVKIDPTFSVSDRPASEEYLRRSAEYIRRTVRRYRNSPALDHWWLMNEPGHGPSTAPPAMHLFRNWLEKKYATIEALNAAWRRRYGSFAEITADATPGGAASWSAPAPFLDWAAFSRDRLTWVLQWITDRIREEDTAHPLHTNPHGVFGNLPQYDFPAWRNFLSSLGASIHPSWHFTMLDRDQYAIGVAATCAIIRGAIEPKPFWVSELQGGNNTWSGNRPLGPEAVDIAQWAWTGIGCGAKKIVFWLLNNRSGGQESGEWSMLDFQGNPSDRLLMASRVARTIERERGFFEYAAALERRVTILLSPESMFILARKARRGLAGREALAHVQSAMGYYETLSELGIPADFKYTDDFDWEGTTGHLCILPNAVAVPRAIAERAETFVANGNTLIIDGLTGYFDENEVNVLQTGFFFEQLCGATVKDIRAGENIFPLALDNVRRPLPAHLWQTEILNHTAAVAGRAGDRVTAVRNAFGRGEVVWVPSLIGLGAWLEGNDPLADWLVKETAPFAASLPVRFRWKTDDAVLQTLQSGDRYLSVVTNGKSKPVNVALRVNIDRTPRVLFSTDTERNTVIPAMLNLGPRETIVIMWE